MARTYKRDSNGRFASTGGARSGRPAARPVSRGRNRITRDNAGRITSVGGEGATARGGRLRTAAGNRRAVQTARIKGRRAGTVPKPKVLRPGEVAERIMNKDRATIKALDVKIQRTEARSKQLARSQREIDYKRANPVGGKAFRGQATKRLNKQQKKLEKSMAKVFSARELVYKPRQDKAYSRLAQLHKATQSASGLKVSKRGASYQRSLFGGSTARYF